MKQTIRKHQLKKGVKVVFNLFEIELIDGNNTVSISHYDFKNLKNLFKQYRHDLSKEIKLVNVKLEAEQELEEMKFIGNR